MIKPRLTPIWLMVALLLTGCQILPERPPPAMLHDLGQTVAKPLDSNSALQQITLEVQAPDWLDDGSIHYRMPYRDATLLQAYQQDRWAAPPSHLLAERLRQQLGIGQKGSSNQYPPRQRLTLELLEFTQQFDSPGQAKVVLWARLKLFDGVQRQLLGSTDLHLETACASADAQGALQAFALISNQLVERSADWIAAVSNQRSNPAH